MKKTLALVLAAAMTTTMLAGCGSSKKEAGNSSNASTSTSDKKMNIKMTVMSGPKKPNSWLEDELSKKLDVDLDFVMLPGWEEKNVKTNLMMQDPNEMPDILWFNGQEKEFRQWVDAGLIVDMLPLLKNTKDKNILKFMQKDTLFPSFEDGKLYRLPSDIGGNGCCMSTTIRKDWLDKLKLKAPTTIDEMWTVLRAFTNNDPDGNGKKDTWGLAGANVGTVDMRNFAPIFYALGYDPDSFDIKDGVVTHGSVLPETKKGIEILRDMYKEGLIHPKTFEKNDFDEMLAQGQFGMFYRWQEYVDMTKNKAYQALKAQVPTAELQSIEPIKGPDGFSGDYPEPLGSWCYIAVTNRNKDSQKVVDVLDKMMTPEIKMLNDFGKEGEHYTLENGLPKAKIDDNKRNDLGLGSLGWIVFAPDTLPKDPVIKKISEDRAKTADNMRDRKVYFRTTFEKLPTWKENGQAITDQFQEVFLGIVTGQKDISEFDKYVNDFYNKYKGKQIEKELTDLYKQDQDAYKDWGSVYEKELKVK